jgi:putative spermidine/putrescine transport system ATP-binding protein
MGRSVEPDLNAHVEAVAVTKRYGGAAVLDGVDLAINQGALVTLLGPSGCGKTTLLRIVAGLASPDAGRVRIGGREVTSTPPHRRNVGFVFQNYALFPHLDVAGNVGFGLSGRGLARAEIARKAARALDLVQLGRLAARPVSALSGGQQQRVALARALAVEPSVMLFDEALSALDKSLRETMQTELRRLLKSLGATAIFVTHDQDEALTMSDRVAVMNRGRIEQYAEPQTLYAAPATLFAMRFVGVSCELAGVVKDTAGGRLSIATRAGMLRAQGGLGVGARAIVATRPEHARFVEGPGQENSVEGRVRQVAFQGPRKRVAVDIGEGSDFIVELGGDAALPDLERPVRIGWPPEKTFAYAAPGAAP